MHEANAGMKETTPTHIQHSVMVCSHFLIGSDRKGSDNRTAGIAFARRFVPTPSYGTSSGLRTCGEKICSMPPVLQVLPVVNPLFPSLSNDTVGCPLSTRFRHEKKPMWMVIQS